jgi:hypothetical protein
MKPVGTYVYCLVAAPRRPRVGRLRGLAGAGPVRLIERGRTGRLKKWLVVADVPLDRYGEGAINKRLSDLDWVSRAAMAHESVVESFAAAPALVPMKLFTIFTGDARVSEHFDAATPRIDAAVKRVRGRVELGVRVTLARARKTRPAGAAAAPASGTAYLSGKKALRDSSIELAVRAREVVAEIFDELANVAASALRRTGRDLPVADGPLLLDAAFLVPRTRVARFRALVRRRAGALDADGYRVVLTGPWPPYTFVKD